MKKKKFSMNVERQRFQQGWDEKQSLRNKMFESQCNTEKKKKINWLYIYIIKIKFHGLEGKHVNNKEGVS